VLGEALDGEKSSVGLFDSLFGKTIPLAEAIELTSVDVFASSVAQVQTLIGHQALPEELGTNPDELNETAWSLTFELMVFSLHLADRIAFGVLGAVGRPKFMDALLSSVASKLASSILTDASQDAQSQFHSSFQQLYNDRVTFYAELAFPSGGDAPLRGTLFWEAAKLCAKQVFPQHESKATIMLSIAFGSTVQAVKNLKGRLAHIAEI
jgi:hypothetical protein